MADPLDPNAFMKNYGQTGAATDAITGQRGLSGSSSAEPGEHAAPLVYWGGATPQEALHGYNDEGQIKTLDDAMIDFYRWTDAERATWGDRLKSSGLIDDASSFGDQLKFWQLAVQGASDYYTNAGRKVTPWAFMSLYSKDGINKPSQAGTRTRVDQDTYVPDASEAHAAIESLFQEQMGRSATDGELDRYTSMMLSKFKANPSKVTTTTTTDEQGIITAQNAVTEGKYDPTEDLLNKSKADPEWGAYQAATTYFNALQGALKAPGG